MTMKSPQISNCLSQWISEEYLSDTFLKEGVLSHPFPHKVLSNFLKSDALNHLRKAARTIKPEMFSYHSGGYQYAFFPSTDFLKFVYGENFRNYISQIFLKKIQPSKSFPIPQLYKFSGNQGGLGIHNDYGTGRDIAMLIYLHEAWAAENQGELLLYEKTRQGKFCEIKRIQPEPNSLVLFEISKISFHSVRNICGLRERVTLITDWVYV